MLAPVPKKTKTEQKKFTAQISAYQKQQAKLEKPVSFPLLLPDPKLPSCIIIDIDGVLAHRCDRGIFDFEKSIDDAVSFPVKYMLQLVGDSNKWTSRIAVPLDIILLTGREECFRNVTNKWLNRHDIPYHHMFMRRTGDKRKASIVKEEIWAGNIRNKYNVFFVIEDTQDNIDMFRSHGLYVWGADNSRDGHRQS